MSSPEPLWGRRARAFGAVAERYERGRPGYPSALLNAALPTSAGRVLDLGAGTGKLTGALLGLGRSLRVVAVEPDAAMRERIPAGAQVCAGTAEAIPLADACLDAVLIGQAFHWFDQQRAVPELARVLRPGGQLVLLWNHWDVTLPWVRALADLLRSEDRSDRFDRLGPPLPAGQGFAPPRQLRAGHTLVLSRAGLVDNAASRSNLALLDPTERDAILAEVAASAPGDPVELPLICTAWVSAREEDR